MSETGFRLNDYTLLLQLPGPCFTKGHFRPINRNLKYECRKAVAFPITSAGPPGKCLICNSFRHF